MKIKGAIMIYDPMDTSYMAGTNIEKVKYEMGKYLIETTDVNLNYEVNIINDITPIFITGKSDVEKALPVLVSAMILTDSRGKKYLITDLRGMLKNLSSDFRTLGSIAINRDVVNFHIHRAILIMLLSSGNSDSISPVRDKVIYGFGKWFSDIIGTALMLSPIEKLDTFAIAVHWYVRMMYDKPIKEDGAIETSFDSYKVFNITDKSGVGKQWVNERLRLINREPRTIDDFIENLKIGVDSVKFKGLEKRVIYTILGKTSFLGPDITAIAIEHPATWTALMYASLNNKGYQHTRTGKSLDMVRRQIGNKEFISYFEHQILDNLTL